MRLGGSETGISVWPPERSYKIERGFIRVNHGLFIVYRAYVGDDDGSVYIQAFSTYLKEQYKKRSLDKIYLMVKQAMIKCEQVNRFLFLYYFSIL